MTSQPEVIDLTQSPQREIIVLSDDESHSITGRYHKHSRNTVTLALLDRISIDVNGDTLRQDGGGSGDGSKRKRKKRKKKATVVVEDGEIGLEGGLEEEDEVPRERINGHSENGKDGGELGRTLDVARHSASLLSRIAGLPHVPEVSNAHKRSDVSGRSEEDPRGTERSSKKRKRRERGSDETRDRSHSPFSSGLRRSYSPGRHDLDRPLSSAAANDAVSSLFFVDIKPVEIPDAVKLSIPLQPTPNGSGPHDADTQNLLLPAHVSLEDASGAGPIQILPPSPLDSEEEDYIDYLDYGDDDRKGPGVVRYFEDPNEHVNEGHDKPRRFVCKNCGAADDHKSWDCPVIICLTCGARDEHSTRSCPISKVCFSCGMKGHTRNMCPNRYDRTLTNHYDDCDRCGSSGHQAKECPTLWRMYEYVDDASRQSILRSREEKADFVFGDGGEGYIASDEWCYNCGESGHLGDDCESLPHPYDFPKLPSAFGMYNIASGPFFDPSVEQKASSSRRAKKPLTMREAEEWADGHGFVLPTDIGKQGRRKEKERLAKKVRDTQVDEEEDWFNRSGQDAAKGSGNKSGERTSSGRGPGNGRGKGLPGGLGDKKLSFGVIGRDEGRYSTVSGNAADKRNPPYDDLPRPSRETDSIQIRGAAKKYSDERRYPDEKSSGSRQYPEDRHTFSSRNKDRWRADRSEFRGERDRDHRNAPRYKGGYGRS